MDTPESRFYAAAKRTRRQPRPSRPARTPAAAPPPAAGRRVEISERTGPGVRVETLADDPRRA